MPFTETFHVLHSHRAVVVIVALALAAVAIAVWIAAANFREDCARPGPRQSSRPPNDRRTRR